MSQITQIVESNNGKLLGLFIWSDVNRVTMKISLGAINEIINLSGDTTTKSYRNKKTIILIV
jgi:hypothetical protein